MPLNDKNSSMKGYNLYQLIEYANKTRYFLYKRSMWLLSCNVQLNFYLGKKNALRVGTIPKMHQHVMQIENSNCCVALLVLNVLMQ